MSWRAPLDLRGPHDEPHGKGGTRAARAIEQRAIIGVQRQAQERASSASTREIFSTRGT